MNQIQQVPQKQMIDPRSFVDKAMARREARLEKATAKEIKDLNELEKTGVMSPMEAETLRTLALASLQIDKGAIKMPPKPYKPIEHKTPNKTFNA